MATFSTYTVGVRSFVPAVSETFVPLCVNPAGIKDYSPIFPFTNFARVFRWTNTSYQKNLTLNVNGYPASTAAGQTHVKMYSSGNAQTVGSFKLRWKSVMGIVPTLSSNGSLSSPTYDSGAGYWSANITGASGTMEVRWSRPDGLDGSLDFEAVDLFPTGDLGGGVTAETLFDAGEFFLPQYIELLKFGLTKKRPYALRFMDWMGVNGLLDARDNADVHDVDWANYASETAPEVIANLINKVCPQYAVICFPYNSTSGFRQAWMTAYKAAVTVATFPIFEHSNETWNSSFAQYVMQIGDGIEKYAVAGLSGFYNPGVTATLTGTKELTLESGGWATITGTGADAANTLSFNRLGSTFTHTSGDVINLGTSLTARGLTIGDTGTVYFGTDAAREDLHVFQIEQVHLDGLAVYGAENFGTILSAWYNGNADIPTYFEYPYTAQIDPSFPDPATRHRFFSPATYFGNNVVTEDMVQRYETGTDIPGALADLAAAILVTAAMPQAQTLRTALDTYAPALKMFPYEGGGTWQTTAIDTDNGLSGGAWTTYTYADANALTTAVRDVDDIVPSVDLWFDKQQEVFVCIAQFNDLNDPDQTSGHWGLFDDLTGTADKYAARILHRLDCAKLSKFAP